MRRWELWGSMFFPEDNDDVRQMAIGEGLTLTWQCWAIGGNEAMQKMYDHCGYGTYKPMLRSDGTPYPEDELDYFCDICSSYYSHQNKCPHCAPPPPMRD